MDYWEEMGKKDKNVRHGLDEAIRPVRYVPKDVRS
jgi:hypothetical protein